MTQWLGSGVNKSTVHLHSSDENLVAETLGVRWKPWRHLVSLSVTQFEECIVREENPILPLSFSQALFHLLMICVDYLPSPLGLSLFEYCRPKFIFDTTAVSQDINVLCLCTSMMSAESFQCLRPFTRSARSKQPRQESRL